MDAGEMLKGIKAGIGFLTTIPVKHDDSGFKAFFNHVHLFIVVGAIVGGLLGIAGYLLQYFMPPALVPVLVVFAILLLTGINHLDGLSDMGDGIIASGTKEKKIAAMKDVHAGAGGILFIGMDLLFLYAAVSLFAGFHGFYLLIGLFVAEICAKVSMITAAAFGKSLHEGMGSMLIQGTRKEHYLIGLGIAIIACVLAVSLLVLPFLQPQYWQYAGLTFDVFRLMQFALAGFLTVAVSVAAGLIYFGRCAEELRRRERRRAGSGQRDRENSGACGVGDADMDALVMAGGKGRRMGGEEKPMVPLAEKPLVSYVLKALLGSPSVGRVYVAVSPGVPLTMAYVKDYPDERVSSVLTPGSGYVEDMAYAVNVLGLYEPVLVVSADLPLMTPEIIDARSRPMGDCGKEALSVRVDARRVSGKWDIILLDAGMQTIPAGINVVHGAHMDRAQDEYILVLDDPGLAMNVNYKKDLAMCERLLENKLKAAVAQFTSDHLRVHELHGILYLRGGDPFEHGRGRYSPCAHAFFDEALLIGEQTLELRPGERKVCHYHRDVDARAL